ncbi:hypothetical protein M3I54_17035 [Paraburkholderia sp. CNPSo 3274]|uniref:hypothetical protein n=1 Tax=Paraburkholderia sp. CNPSo 3274 TaxID=2940932 RepID=UPI0020B87B2E|nr:hypothetical protein [Paraburkholderia sp. CNPSo 3274]MCP3708677.1 hypothetical protein [Paraburkholderia sp. CNPSo 3274]
MTVPVRLYRGLEIYPLVYPHRPTAPGSGHNYDEGFDAAVRIREPQELDGSSRSRVFGVAVGRPFTNAGDARRASVAYAEHLIDSCSPDASVLDLTS